MRDQRTAVIDYARGDGSTRRPHLVWLIPLLVIGGLIVVAVVAFRRVPAPGPPPPVAPITVTVPVVAPGR